MRSSTLLAMSRRLVLPTCIAASSFFPLALAHVQMSDPLPLRSPLDTANADGLRDYDNTAPLSPDGSNFPCKGYHKNTPLRATANYTAGETYDLGLRGEATHHGGSCQLSLSYDGGSSFKVIESMIGGCPLEKSYKFTIPPQAPTGQALFAWTWVNHEGNREFYMNCAVVDVEGRGGVEKRDAAVALNSLPDLFVANLAGINSCTVPEGEDAVFPNPGTDVAYGGGISADSPVSCQGESATTEKTDSGGSPEGAARADGGESKPGGSPEYEGDVEQSTNMRNDQPSSGGEPAPSEGKTTQPADETDSAISSAANFAPLPTTTPPAEEAHHDPDAGYNRVAAPIREDAYCEPEEIVTVTLPRPPGNPYGYNYTATTLRTITRTSRQSVDPRPTLVSTTVSPPGYPSSPPISPPLISPPLLPPPPPPPPSSRPPYAATPEDIARYQPCVPGTFLCTSPSTFLTCLPSASSSPTFSAPRSAAPGMMCLPSWSPYSSATSGYAAGSGGGASYRDDRHVRSRPLGDCDVNGALGCTRGGEGFMVCDQGGWVDMGSVAAGTRCVGGRIAAA